MSLSLATKSNTRFTVKPLSPNCHRLWKQRKHALVGISPFNSRFSDDYIDRVIAWALAEFEQVSVLLAGEEAGNLLEALGAPKTKADRKVRKEVARNRRAAERSLENHGGNPTAVYTFSDFPNHPVYQLVREETAKAFERELHFKQASLSMSKMALEGRARGVGLDLEGVDDAMLMKAVEYVIAEMPFFLSGADILAVEQSVLIYHQPWQLGQQIVAGEFSLMMRHNQGYITIQEEQVL